MKTLQIYPTSRAIRSALAQWQQSDTLVPSMMRIDEFEQRAVTLGNRALIDPLQRVLLIREAADFEAFRVFKVDRALVKFLSSSDGLFRFFEELAFEKVDFQKLAEADPYAEFGEHLLILETLKNRYRALLEAQGLTDRMFVPELARIHEGFSGQYDQIEIFLEGLLSHYEMELFAQCAKHTTLTIHYTTSPFSAKMAERFDAMGIVLHPHADNTINLSEKQVIRHDPAPQTITAHVTAVTERFEQISAAMIAIQEMVESGIAPERIALILPDEGFKEAFRLYDHLNNFNFAMGFDYKNGRNYKMLHALFDHWRLPDDVTAERLEKFGISEESITALSPSEVMNCETFFVRLDTLELSENDPLRTARVTEAREEMRSLFDRETLHTIDWLSLWLQKLGTIRIDDLRGGMVTVMGVLETRGVTFDGIVIVDFNDGIVPAATAKDQYLNSQVRAFADLPTRSDREALQKYYYHQLLSRAQSAEIIYAVSDSRLPSKFLYELGLEAADPTPVPYCLLYDQPSRLVPELDPVVETFDATAQTWSASRLRSWLACRRQYYYRYIRGIKQKKETELNEGALLHDLMDKVYHDRDRYDSAQLLRDRLHHLMDELLPSQNPRIAYQKILWKHKLEPLITQQIAHFEAGWRVVDREREFTGEIGGLRFGGRIDRIDRDAAHTLMIDYKSGSLAEANRSKNLDKAIDFQMNIYRHLVRPKYSNVTLVFQKLLDDAATVEANALEEKEEIMGRHIAELKQTRSFIAEKTDHRSRCTYCPYTLMCRRGAYV